MGSHRFRNPSSVAADLRRSLQWLRNDLFSIQQLARMQITLWTSSISSSVANKFPTKRFCDKTKLHSVATNEYHKRPLFMHFISTTGAKCYERHPDDGDETFPCHT